MKISKIAGKKAAVIAIAAVGVLIAGSASAAGAVAIVGSSPASPQNYLLGWNKTAGCVIFYANHQSIAVKPGAWSNLGPTGRNKNYMALATDHACGQSGSGHYVKFNTSNAATVKNHTRGWNFNWVVQ
ncbi:MAG TPA: hypothetical protein VF616_26645 [Duganella sp.]|uniref:hypothetical protein n=1 Tax=Duganella sp. TaxID=1904440 RepID=UPI002ED14381